MIGATDSLQPEGAADNGLNVFSVPASFKIKAVDGLTSPEPDVKPDVIKDLTFSFANFSTFASAARRKTQGLDDAIKPVPGELNILEKLNGSFHGAGLNMIFRPSFGNNRRDNVLEYNLTEETTQFLDDIGDVPNRGLGRQQDVIVKAVPYIQRIVDLLDRETGNPDRKDPIPIHFESGMFLRTPPTEIRPVVLKGTISRLASIPHGTTINCQGIEPDMKNPTSGNPVIETISILPFPQDTPTDVVTFNEFFPQLVFEKRFNLRIPQEIKPGDALNAALMQNPNKFLNEHNESSTKKRIIDHIKFSVHSDAKALKIPGGGTTNIAFLEGPKLHDPEIKDNQNQGPNAKGVTVDCTYWVSTVEYDVLLPEGDFSGEKRQVTIVESEARKEEIKAGKVVISPSFYIVLDKKVPANTTVKLQATQIQYSQRVILDFDAMGWPHVSVATLSPQFPVPVEAHQVVF